MPSKWDFETDVLSLLATVALACGLQSPQKRRRQQRRARAREGAVARRRRTAPSTWANTWVDDVDGAVKYITGFTKGHTPEEIARAWAEECYNNMDYCDHWGVKTEKKKGTNASGGTSSCSIRGLMVQRLCTCARLATRRREATRAGTRLTRLVPTWVLRLSSAVTTKP